MKYNDLRKCLNFAEEVCKASGLDISDADIGLRFDESREWRCRMDVRLSYSGADVEIGIVPKGEDNEQR